MTLMLGMNDGGYHAFDQKTFDAYTQGYNHILDSVRATLPNARLTLIEPSPFDDVTQTPKFEGGYNAVLIRFSQFLKERAAKDQMGVADLNTPMVAMLQKANAANPAMAQKIIPDRVHPSPAGHLVMAESLLKSWNAPSVVTDVEIDATAKRVRRAENSQVEKLKKGKTISWTQTDNALPMPGPWSDSLAALVLKSSDFTDALNQERLRVDGLTAAVRYSLTIDGQDVGDFTGEQLASGINLATLPTPMAQQAAKVAALTTRHNDQHVTRWRTLQVPLEKDANPAVQKALPSLLAALDSEEAETVVQQQAAAQPVPHQYEITPALPDATGPNLALHKPYSTNAPNKYGYGIGALTDGSWDTTGDHTFATDDARPIPKNGNGSISEWSRV